MQNDGGRTMKVDEDFRNKYGWDSLESQKIWCEDIKSFISKCTCVEEYLRSSPYKDMYDLLLEGEYITLKQAEEFYEYLLHCPNVKIRDGSISGCSCLGVWGEIYEQVMHDSEIFRYALKKKSIKGKKTVYEMAIHSGHSSKQKRIVTNLFPNISIEEIKSVPDISPETVNHFQALSQRYLIAGIIFLILGSIYLLIMGLFFEANTLFGIKYVDISFGYEIIFSIFLIVSFSFFSTFFFYENKWKRDFSLEFKGARFYKIGLPTDHFPLKLNRIEEHYVPSENDSDIISCPSCHASGKNSVLKTIYAGNHRVYDREPSFDDKGHEDLNTFHYEPSYKEVREEVECTVCNGTGKVLLSSVAESFNRSIDNYNELLDKLIEKFSLIYQWKDEFNAKLDAWNSKFGNNKLI